MAAVPSTPAPALCDNAPSKGVQRRLHANRFATRVLRQLHQATLDARPHGHHRALRGRSATVRGSRTNTSVPDDAPMSEDYDALDYVLNSNDFSAS